MRSVPAGRNQLFLHSYPQGFFEQIEIGAGQRQVRIIVDGNQRIFVRFVEMSQDLFSEKIFIQFRKSSHSIITIRIQLFQLGE